MAVDPTSPISPARVRIQLLPIGPLKRSRYLAFTKRLHRESSIRLGDISPDTRQGKTAFSPLAFPNGAILYNMCTSELSAFQVALSPLETFRETFLVFGIADATEFEPGLDFDVSISNLWDRLDNVAPNRPQALVTKLLVFDVPESHTQKRAMSNVVCIPSLEMSRSTTMKTIMCDISAEFLGELSSYAAKIQNQQTIDSPAVGTDQMTNVPSPSSRSLDLTRTGSITEGSRPATPAQNGEVPPVAASSTSFPNIPLQPALTNSRPSSPANAFDTQPTNVGDIENETHRSYAEESTSKRARPKTMAFVRDSDRDRKSQQTTTVSSTDRARNRVKARQSIIIGTLHLHAGRWTDALRELVDGTTRARAFSDHLWHAKGLENILISLLLLAWTGGEFQIPKICYPVSDSKSVLPRSSSSTAGLTAVDSTGRSSTEVQVQSLSSLVSEIVHMIVSIHIRAYNFQGEGLPQSPFSECIVRLSRLLAIVNIEGGFLTKDAFQAIVFAKPISARKPLISNSSSPGPTKRDVCSLLFKAYPVNIQTSDIPLVDVISIYSGIASVLSMLGLHRKRAMVIKELLSSLVPSLIQARKVGAAELGIHPAASLAALHGLTGENKILEDSKTSDEDTSVTFQNLFLQLCVTYGVLSDAEPSLKDDVSNNVHESPPNTDDVIKEILEESLQRSFGNFNLKVDVLRLCANFSEALPDFANVMEFSAALLKTAGPGIAPEAGSMDGLVLLAREEQIRVATKMHRTLGVFPTSETARLETTYWDKFLVRGISLLDVGDEKRLMVIRKSELSGTQSDTAETSDSARGPFLHNPFLKSKQQEATQNFVAAKEQITFEVLLQNLYDFEVIVESIELITEGVEFMQDQHSLVLGPFRIQRAFVSGMAANPGQLKISGCSVKFQGCLKQSFLNFTDAWTSEKEVKIKRTGLEALRHQAHANLTRTIDETNESKHQTASTKLIPSTNIVSVVHEQPLLSIVGTSSSQSIVDVLEGETTTFSITVRNESATSLINFLQLSFTDTIGMSVDTSDRNSLRPSELYEQDFSALYRQPLRWIRSEEERDLQLRPGELKTVTVSVLGRAGLSRASVYISYAFIDGSFNEGRDKIYTRRLCLPLTITVNPSTRLHNFNVTQLPILTTSHQTSTNEADEYSHNQHPYAQEELRGMNESSFMLLLDLRNYARNPMIVRMYRSDAVKDGLGNEMRDEVAAISDIVQPGHTVRFPLHLQKVHVTDSRKRIPYLRPDSQRQHVVDASRNVAEEEAQLTAFWYREKLLDVLRAEWQEVTSMRRGDLDLRGISLTKGMVEIIRQDRLTVKMDVKLSPCTEGTLKKTRLGNYHAKTDDFLTITTTVGNRSNEDLGCLLVVQPKVNADTSGKTTDLTRRIAWTGLLRRHLKILKPNEHVEVQIGLNVLSAGNYEISASAHLDTLRTQYNSQVQETVRLPLELLEPAIETSNCIGAATCHLIVDDG